MAWNFRQRSPTASVWFVTISAGRWLSSARAAGFTSVVTTSSHLTAASCAMAASSGNIANKPIASNRTGMVRGIGDRLLESLCAFRTAAG